MSSPNAPQPPLNASPAVWGFIAAVIYGITVLQTFYYYTHHGHRDKLAWLVLAAVIFILDSAAMALFMYCVYYYLVTSSGVPEMLTPDIKAFSSEYFITTVLAFIVRNFYINTIRALRAPLIFTIVLFLTSLTALAAGFVLPIVQPRLKLIDIIVGNWLNHTAFSLACVMTLACDLGIVFVLCWFFMIRKTNVRQANNVLDALIVFAVHCGVLQALVQAGEVISYAVKPTGIYFLPFHVVVSRIYCTSLLATLNSREYVLSRGMSTYEQRMRRIDDPELGDVTDVSTPPGLGADETPRRPRAGRWASTVSTSRTFFTSFLEPPFLFSNASDERARDGGGRRSVFGARSAPETGSVGMNASSCPVLSLPPGILTSDSEKSPHDAVSELGGIPELLMGSTGSFGSERNE